MNLFRPASPHSATRRFASHRRATPRNETFLSDFLAFAALLACAVVSYFDLWI